jgi:hypothetical protein
MVNGSKDDIKIKMIYSKTSAENKTKTKTFDWPSCHHMTTSWARVTSVRVAWSSRLAQLSPIDLFFIKLIFARNQ